MIKRAECVYCYTPDKKCLESAAKTGRNCCKNCNGHELESK